MQLTVLCWFCAVLFSCNVLGRAIRRGGFRTAEEQMGYLQRYGYLRRSSHANLVALSADSGDTEVKMAVRRFQKMAGIPQTGLMDEATIRMMNAPRCGMPDHMEIGDYRLSGTKWSKRMLTYRIQNYTRDLSQSQQINTIWDAFMMWRKVAQLDFSCRSTSKWPAITDLNIGFSRQDHGDGYPFDGPQGTLAHAFFPQNGNIHFDDDEQWTIGGRSGIDLLQVAVHEIGHALGLQHSELKDSIMHGMYKYNLDKVELHSDDISGIQQLYGPRTSATRG